MGGDEATDAGRARGRSEDPWTRSQAAEDRDQSAHDRDRSADDRDGLSEAQDRAAEVREERADSRDRRADAREHTRDRPDGAAASDRAAAWSDRQGAASDRRRSAGDRAAAATDRELSARERAVSSIDDLTGAYRRDAGLVELEREIARAKRTHEPFVLAFVDVDGLKAVNDSRGHSVGDRLLLRVVEAIRDHTRTYDLIVRFGGDEFLCAFLDLTVDRAAERFALINADLRQSLGASITAGLADLREDDKTGDLIDRADGALRAERQKRPTGRG